MSYERLGTFEPQEVLPFITSKTKEKFRFYRGRQVKMTSQRYELFRKKGLTCSCCGLTGIYFALERHPTGNTRRFHFNLYGINKQGGPNKQKNYQVLCSLCNREKGNNV